jgi:MFS family permease
VRDFCDLENNSAVNSKIGEQMLITESFLDNVLQKNNFFRIQSVFYRNLLARTAVYYTFMLEGIYMGVWGRYLPSVQDEIGLSDSLLGTSVLFMYFGTVIVSPLVAFLLRNFGSRVTTVIGQWTFIASLPLIPLAHSFGLLVFFMFNFGLCMGIMDISMNNSAILTEIVAGKPLLGSFHGSYSVAAALGSLLGGVFIGANLETETAFLLVFGCGLFLSLLTFWNLYDYEQEQFLTEYHVEDRKEITKSLLASEYEVETRLPEADDRPTVCDSYQRIPVLDNNRGTVITYGYKDDDENRISSCHNPNARLTESEFVPAHQLFAHNDDSKGKEAAYSPFHNDTAVSASRNSDFSTEESTCVLSNNCNGFSFDGLYKARKVIFFFSLVGFLGAFGESGILTWSVVYFDRYIPSASVVQSLGLTCFMSFMAVGRFTCDYLRRVFGRRKIIRAGGLFAFLGLLLVVGAPDLPVSVLFACLGFALTGLGLSTIIPIVFSSAGHLENVHAGTVLATVAACSYSGSIVSSPTIGLLSDLFGSLRIALLIDGILLGLIFFLSWGILAETAVFSPRKKDLGQTSEVT